jgi:hypothetical protein
VDGLPARPAAKVCSRCAAGTRWTPGSLARRAKCTNSTVISYTGRAVEFDIRTCLKPVATAFFLASPRHSFAATALPKTALLIDDANEEWRRRPTNCSEISFRYRALERRRTVIPKRIVYGKGGLGESSGDRQALLDQSERNLEIVLGRRPLQRHALARALQQRVPGSRDGLF